jgi:hypothetical protein
MEWGHVYTYSNAGVLHTWGPGAVVGGAMAGIRGTATIAGMLGLGPGAPRGVRRNNLV